LFTNHEPNHTYVSREVNTYFISIDSTGFPLGRNYLIRATTEVIGENADIFGGSGPVRRLRTQGGENVLKQSTNLSELFLVSRATN
jgi:hypothetical protein